MKTRREFPAKVKVAAFKRCGGHCEGGCGARLYPGKYRYDHIIPDWMDGEPTLENCSVRCLNCDAPKTAADQTAIAKVKRMERLHLGAKAPGRSLPCGRASKWKKTFNHGVVPR